MSRYLLEYLIMNQHAHMHETAPISAHADFLARFKKNLRKELAGVLQTVFFIIRLICISLIGIFLFIKEFNISSILFALIAPPLFIFLVGSNLTLLSKYLIALMVSASIISLYSSKEGESFIGWIDDVIHSLMEGSAESANSSLSQKLMGFVILSAIISFFLVFLV